MTVVDLEDGQRVCAKGVAEGNGIPDAVATLSKLGWRRFGRWTFADLTTVVASTAVVPEKGARVPG